MHTIHQNPILVSVEAMYILQKLTQTGFEAYIVGGAVRDTLLDAFGSQFESDNKTQTLSAKDYDFTTNALPDEIQELFPENYYENSFGTVGIARKHLRDQMNLPALEGDQTVEHQEIDLSTAEKIHESLENGFDHQTIQSKSQDEIYEITTFRSDGIYADNRRPNSVTWGKSIQEDLERRDFTINALALKIDPAVLETATFDSDAEFLTIQPDKYEIIDNHGGIQDLESGIISTVGAPNKRFQEDALRMLRAIRFSVQLNMQIEADTFDAIIANSQLLKKISFERISDEFLKMLSSEFPKQAIELLDETKLLQHIIPELLDGKGVQQGGHHTSDVWTHNLDALAECPSSDPIVRLATLLHDIAKPHTYKESEGKPTFYNHEIIGSRMAKKIAKRLRLSKNDIERVFLLVRYHMFYYQPENTDASIRRFMRKVGLNNLNDILNLREADRLGSGARKTSWRLEEMKERMREQLNQPFSIKDLAVNGTDLMSELQISPGPQLGELLQQLFELVLEDPNLNTKEELLSQAKVILKK